MRHPRQILREIISGGQTGADQAGLRAAKALGLATGGWAPLGWKTDEGPAPWLGIEYGLKECRTRGYSPRTVLNVRTATGTVLFGNVNSPGCRLTREVAQANRKPYIENPTVEDLITFIREHDVTILNVAGNRERTNPGIGTRVEALLTEALR